MFVIAGEALIDIIVGDESNTLSSHIGGSPFNTALALARLGHQVGFMHPLSDDNFGEQIHSRLTGNGVEYICPYRSEWPTPLAMVALDQRGQANYRFYRATTADRDLREQLMLQALPQRITVMHSGSLAIASAQDAAIIARLFRHAQECGALLSVDPNIRAAKVKDVAGYRHTVLNFLQQADIIKLSDEDLEFLYPEMSKQAAFSQLWQTMPKAKFCVLTSGTAAITACFAGKEVKYQPKQLAITGDTIGAGDCFTAGMLHQWHAEAARDQAAIIRILAMADRVARTNCMRDGCDPPTLAELLP